MRRLAAVAFFLSFVPFVFAAADERPSVPSLAAEVSEIFKAKCVECHGADLKRPKGRFGYVLDLARVAANPDYIVPGKPDDSELYLMIEDDEMPGDEASTPALTPEEKEIVKRWIELGAPDTEAVAVASAPSEQISQKAAPVPNRNFTTTQRVIRFLGQFHPPSSHFPIALLIAALPAEAMWKLTRKASWKATVRFCVMLGAASAIVTAGLGWCDAVFTNYTGASAPLLAWHRWLGTATAAWALLTAILSEFAHKEGYPRSLRYGFRLTLLGGVILVSISGYLGASLIYGLNHFTW